MEIKGDLVVKRTLVADRRVDQGLNADTITGAEALSRHSAFWQSLSAVAAQNVVLPDATGLPNGWSVVVHATGAETLTVQDNDANDTVATVAPDEAKKFILTDNGDADGTWFVDQLLVPAEAAAQRYTLTHDATTDWGVAGGGYYTIATTAATHGRGTRPTVQFYETVDDDEVEVTPDRSLFATATGNHSFRVPEDPDLRYAGKAIFV